VRLTSDSDPTKNANFRSSVYAILALAFSPPKDQTPGLYQAILDAHAALSPHENSPATKAPDSKASSVAGLDKEYLRLFVGPGHVHCPPYEAVYRKERPLLERGLVMGQSAVDVRRKYAEANLKLSDKFTDLPDHIALEMEFMHFLCTEESKSMEQGIAEDTVTRRNMQREFLKDHLTHWAEPFADCVLKSDSSFYKAAASLLKVFTKSEFEYLVTEDPE
jgi:TorA maturation chaperone TorD